MSPSPAKANRTIHLSFKSHSILILEHFRFKDPIRSPCPIRLLAACLLSLRFFACYALSSCFFGTCMGLANPLNSVQRSCFCFLKRGRLERPCLLCYGKKKLALLFPMVPKLEVWGAYHLYCPLTFLMQDWRVRVSFRGGVSEGPSSRVVFACSAVYTCPGREKSHFQAPPLMDLSTLEFRLACLAPLVTAVQGAALPFFTSCHSSSLFCSF